MASVGPFDVPGRSKTARMSVARCLRVGPSLRISVSVAGTPLATESITACIMALPCFWSGSR